MNVLFLSISVPPGDKRDTVTYNFIMKEMKELAGRSNNVYFLSECLDENVIIDNIKCISKDKILEKNIIIRRMRNLLFLIKHFRFFWQGVFISIQKTMGICGIERAVDMIIKKYHIDLIHTHFFYPNGENAIISAKKNKLPLIATVRGAELYNCPDIEYGAMLDKYYRVMIKRSLNYVNCITAPNRYLVKKLKDEFGTTPEKVQYLPNGIKTGISITRIKKENDQFQFVAIGRLIKRKNYELLLAAFKALNGNNFRLKIVGNGSLHDSLINYIKENNLKCVSILDEMPQDELFSLMVNSDCLIHPSLIEGLPNVVLESLAVGTPCLVSNIPAHQDLIKDGYNGYLFDPYDATDLISKIRFILSNRNVLFEMRNNCFGSARDYSIEAKIDSYTRIYAQLLSKGHI